MQSLPHEQPHLGNGTSTFNLNFHAILLLQTSFESSAIFEAVSPVSK